MLKKLFIILITLFIVNNISFAKSLSSYNKYDFIFKKAGKFYHIPWFLIKMVAVTENYKMDPNLIRKNKNNTVDIGLMQINTVWIKKLQKKFNHVDQITLKNPIVNIYAGGFILNYYIKKYGYSWESISYYHSFNKKYSSKWLIRIKKNILYFVKNNNNIIIE